MSAVTLEDLEQRVALLEKMVGLKSGNARYEPGRDDWKQTIGMFLGNPVAKEMIDEALRLREEERSQVPQ